MYTSIFGGGLCRSQDGMSSQSYQKSFFGNSIILCIPSRFLRKLNRARHGSSTQPFGFSLDRMLSWRNPRHLVQAGFIRQSVDNSETPPPLPPTLCLCLSLPLCPLHPLHSSIIIYSISSYIESAYGRPSLFFTVAPLFWRSHFKKLLLDTPSITSRFSQDTRNQTMQRINMLPLQ